MVLLEMNHVKKSFGGLEVIRDISLHVGRKRGAEGYIPEG